MCETKTLVLLDTIALLKVYWGSIFTVSMIISSKYLVTNVSNCEFKTVYWNNLSEHHDSYIDLNLQCNPNSDDFVHILYVSLYNI
jgi:hypothetical protein